MNQGLHIAVLTDDTDWLADVRAVAAETGTTLRRASLAEEPWRLQQPDDYVVIDGRPRQSEVMAWCLAYGRAAPGRRGLVIAEWTRLSGLYEGDWSRLPLLCVMLCYPDWSHRCPMAAAREWLRDWLTPTSQDRTVFDRESWDYLLRPDRVRLGPAVDAFANAVESPLDGRLHLAVVESLTGYPLGPVTQAHRAITHYAVGLDPSLRASAEPVYVEGEKHRLEPSTPMSSASVMDTGQDFAKAVCHVLSREGTRFVRQTGSQQSSAPRDPAWSGLDVQYLWRRVLVLPCANRGQDWSGRPAVDAFAAYSSQKWQYDMCGPQIATLPTIGVFTPEAIEGSPELLRLRIDGHLALAACLFENDLPHLPEVVRTLTPPPREPLPDLETLYAQLWPEPSAEALWRFGTKALVRDHSDLAHAVFATMVRRHPDRADACLGVAMSRRRHYGYRDDLEWFERAVTVEPTHTDAWRAYALALRRVDRNGEAVAAWQRVVALAPSDAEAWLWLGEALSVEGDHGGAREAWRQAVVTGTALTEFSEPARWARGYLGEGEPVG